MSHFTFALTHRKAQDKKVCKLINWLVGCSCLTSFYIGVFRTRTTTERKLA